MSVTYGDFEALKRSLATKVASFLYDHPGCSVKLALELEVTTEHGLEKMRLTLAEIPALAPQLPGFEDGRVKVFGGMPVSPDGRSESSNGQSVSSDGRSESSVDGLDADRRVARRLRGMSKLQVAEAPRDPVEAASI